MANAWKLYGWKTNARKPYVSSGKPNANTTVPTGNKFMNGSLIARRVALNNALLSTNARDVNYGNARRVEVPEDNVTEQDAGRDSIYAGKELLNETDLPDNNFLFKQARCS
ncbi:MAG: hypothetical protein L6R38_003000, partial [Xanthoria sp. 2 TBL-2021]